jgi:hypothetical protein
LVDLLIKIDKIMTKSVTNLRKKQLIAGIKHISGMKSDAEVINTALEEYARRLAGKSITELRGKSVWEGDLNKMRTYEDITI